jgi:hypothetical protein
VSESLPQEELLARSPAVLGDGRFPVTLALHAGMP